MPNLPPVLPAGPASRSPTRACHAPKCQTARRQKTQASWRYRNPGYTIAYRIDQRAAQVLQTPTLNRLLAM